MAETVKVPGIGPVKKGYVYVAAAGVAGFVGYAWWTRGGGFAPVEEPGGPVDEFGDERITPNTIDTFDVAVDTRTGITTNGEWSQFVISHLAGLGYDSTVVSTAIGRFLARQPLNKVDLDFARQAWAVGGEPPEGRPWTIIPESSPAAVAVGAVTGLRASKVTATSITITWDAVPGATGYEIKRYGGGTARTSGTSHTSSGLKAGSAQAFFVKAHNSANNYGPEASLTVNTTGSATSGQIGTPTGLRVVSRNRDNTRIRVRWNPVPGAQKYYVSRGSGGHGVMVTRPEHVFSGKGPIHVRAAKGRRPNEILSANASLTI